MRTRGSIIVAVIFIVLLSFIGISLLTFSYMHDKIVAARTRKVLETEKIFQDLVYYLHHFRQKILDKDIADMDQPEIDYFNKRVFPEEKINGTVITNSFTSRIAQKQYYKKIIIFSLIEAFAASNNYGFQAEADIDMLGGQIPLTMFPVFINRKIDCPVDTFLKEKNIVSKDGKKIVVDEIEIKLDMTGFLKDALDIDKARILTWEAIREKFGFEISNEPIEEGIHILFEDDIIKTIFIQGDLERMVFSIQDNIQKINLIKDGVDYELSYKPGEYYFECWDSRISEYSLFKEKIVVNGNAWSIEQNGEAAFLESSNIVLFVSKVAVIRSKLETQNIDLKKIDLTNLTLLSSSKALPGQDNLDSGVVIDIEGEANIQAAIIADGNISNHCTKLSLLGSLYARGLENDGIIEVTHLESKFESGHYFATIDFKYISDFFINFIEEVYDESQ